LASVTVKSADIDLLASEFEITKEQAEVYLRENKGNVEDAIRAVIAV
jgi:NACalpha-BTF3-like transcription factor